MVQLHVALAPLRVAVRVERHDDRQHAVALVGLLGICGHG